MVLLAMEFLHRERQLYLRLIRGTIDSQTQGRDKENPVFHNHYVNLVHDALCGGGLTADLPNAQHITFGSPGKLTIGGSNLLQSHLAQIIRRSNSNQHISQSQGGVFHIGSSLQEQRPRRRTSCSLCKKHTTSRQDSGTITSFPPTHFFS